MSRVPRAVVDGGRDSERGESVGELLAVITVGCDGRPAGAVRQTLGGTSLLERAVARVAEVSPDQVAVSLPDPALAQAAREAGVPALVRDDAGERLEDAVDHALAAHPEHARVLTIDPLLPLIRPGRLAAALTLATRESADCVFSCHRESALLWQRSPMGLVPYFDPARRPDLGDIADDVPWLREDGGFYLLSVDAFRRAGTRHTGRIAPLETDAAEAVLAADAAGLAVCRALIAEASRAAAAAAAAG